MATPTTLPAAFVAGNVLEAAQLNDLRGAFRVLQVVQGQTTIGVTSANNTYVDSGITATITPSSVDSKILVYVSVNGVSKNAGNANNAVDLKLFRGASDIQTIALAAAFNNQDAIGIVGSTSAIRLDSPATTSATTYKVQVRNNFNGSSVTIQRSGEVSTIILMEISA
jgi:hypothetical protein